MSDNMTSEIISNNLPLFNNVSAHPNYNDISIFDKQLYVVSCGKNTCEYANLTCKRQYGRTDYHIIYVKEGYATVTFSNKSTCTLLPGYAAFFNYAEPYSYVYNKADNSNYFWIHFNGSTVHSLLTDLDLTQSCKIHVGLSDYISNIFDSIIRELISQNPVYFKRCTSNLISLLTYLYTKSNSSAHPTIIQNNKIRDIVALMNSTKCIDMTLDDYAELCHLSKSRFIKNFKKVTGHTPIIFKNICLIDNAKWHLANTDLSVTNISNILGFLNPSYFSTLFKKYTNQTPNEYRREELSKYRTKTLS